MGNILFHWEHIFAITKRMYLNLPVPVGPTKDIYMSSNIANNLIWWKNANYIRAAGLSTLFLPYELIDFQQITDTNAFSQLPGLKFVDSSTEILLLLITGSSFSLLPLSSSDLLVSLSFFVWLIVIDWLIWAISSSLGLGSVTCWQTIGLLVEE